jgi:hypothetical protein
MGVVYSYILRVEPGCYLEEERILLPWNEAAKKLPELMSNEQLQSFQLMVSPCPWYNCSWKPFTKEAPVSISTLKYVRKDQIPHSKRPSPPKISDSLVTDSLLTDSLLDDIVVFQTNHIPMLTPIILQVLLQFLSHKPIVLNECEALHTIGGIISTKYVNFQTSECGMEVNKADDIINICNSLINLYGDLTPNR